MKCIDEFRQAIVEDAIKEIKENEKDRDFFECSYSCPTFYIGENDQIIQELFLGDDLFSTEEYAKKKAEFFKEKGYDYLIYINDMLFDEKGFFVEEE